MEHVWTPNEPMNNYACKYNAETRNLKHKCQVTQ